ncbi:DEAD/DEAH box helicase [Catenovulum agarivorans]|uniref:DEAD/DEAH box helicase n=1 Tax=Catenovulum agarivorans TaxID=1172192 RepID=UPI000308909D|nr:DEAD/DEAH box helicase family protein [Catenovulum agarivorans]
MQLRTWQSECVSAAYEFYEHSRHFLCLATPAAGKTIMAATLANKLFESDKVDLTVVISPSAPTCNNAKRVFEKILRKKFDGKLGSVGCSITYQAMLNLDDVFWELLATHRVLVIFDEIHHCAGETLAQANAWGASIIRHVKDRAAYTLSLSGTPWRTDSLPVTLADYNPTDNTIQTHYQYGLGRAIKERVCRLPQVVLIDNENIVVKNKSEQNHFKTFIELFNQKLISYSELLHNENALKYILSAATSKLNELRRHNPNAGGLIVAASVSHAMIIQSLMASIFDIQAVIVSYKSDKSAGVINEFRHSEAPWIISIGMISEGTDIPRLQVCCHLSRVKTELYFRQIIGRILRVTSAELEKAWLYTFAEPNLTNFAHRLADDIPNYPVVLKEDVDEPMNVAAKHTPYKENSLLNSSRSKSSEIFKSKPSLEIAPNFKEAPNYSTNLSQMLHLDVVGKFRQQLVSVYQSPF